MASVATPPPSTLFMGPPSTASFSLDPPSSAAVSPVSAVQTMSNICQAANCVAIFVPILLGVLVSSILLGMVFVRGYRYISLFPDARSRTKRIMIYAVHSGDALFFLRPRWEDCLAPLFAVLLQVQTQFFLLSRTHIYAGVAGMRNGVKWTGTIALSVLILGSGACGMATSLEIKLLNSLVRLSPGHPEAGLLNIVAPAWLVSSAFVDCTLCILVTHELLSARKAAGGMASYNSQAALSVLKRLVRVVLRSGVILALAQTSTAAAWIVEAHTARGQISSSWVYLPIIILPKIYTLTYFSILIAPRRQLSTSASFTYETNSTLPLAYSRNQLSPLTESRRRLYLGPPQHLFGPSPEREGHELSTSRSYEDSRSFPTRPGAPASGGARDQVPSHVLRRDSSYRGRQHSGYEHDLMMEDSLVILSTVHSSEDFSFRPQVLAVAPYALPASPAASSPQYEGAYHPYRQPYEQRNLSTHLPATPPRTPPTSAAQPSDHDELKRSSFVYAPTPPLSVSFAAPRGEKGRMYIPQPALSTVYEGSSGTPRTAEGAYTFPSSSPAAASGAGGRGSWIMLAGPAGPANDGEAAEMAKVEHLASPILHTLPELAKPHPYSALALSPPSLSALPATSGSLPPKSPRLFERRGAVDLLQAEKGRPLRMERQPGELDGFEEGGEAASSNPRMEGSEDSETAPVLARLEREVEAALEVAIQGDDGAEGRPSEPPILSPVSLASHFSSPSSSASFSSPSASPTQVLLTQARHRYKPSFTLSPNGSDTTLDAVLHALRAPLPSSLPLPSSSSSLAAAGASIAPPPPPPTPGKKRLRQLRHRRGEGSFASFSSLKKKASMARTSSSGSTDFACKDARMIEQESRAVMAAVAAAREVERDGRIDEGGSEETDVGVEAW
ncbi:hypothetical protein JCM11641_003954 [Rhodosporidiobolus odoratus]